MSSTACVLRMLTDRAELDGLHGRRTALGILLVQDVAVVPMMLAVSAVAGKQSISSVAGKVSIGVLLAVELVGTFYCLFTFVVPRLFNQRVWQRNRDLPILLAMIRALGSARAAHQLNLSPARGAFVGEVLLAVSPFATQIPADVRPLSTILVTRFLASIGMFGDPWWFLQNWLLVTGIVAAIVVAKPLVITVLANGEDIMFSYVAMSESGRLNRVHRVAVNELPAPHSIHRRNWKGHVAHRTRLLRACEAWLKGDRHEAGRDLLHV